MTDIAHLLNEACHCRSLDADLLTAQLERDPSLAGLSERITRTRPHLFSNTTVFISRDTDAQIHEAVATLDRVMSLPGFETDALAQAPAIAQTDFGPRGVFMGYDFHLAETGPRLIEINTNAGGAWLNAALARANQSCCAAMDWAFEPNPQLATLEDRFMATFHTDWRRQRGDAPLTSVAIIDEHPADQYLAPEFDLCRQALTQRGLQAWVLDPAELTYHDNALWHGHERIDLVYNRLTDFTLEQPAHRALRQAYDTGAVVLTPHPRAHALHADKRHLIRLSDDDQLARWGASEADRLLLSDVVPRTVAVTPDNAQALWQTRRDWFLKPSSSYAAKGAYRGDKLTRRVWDTITASNATGPYIAQAIVPPAQRAVALAGNTADLKFDLRAYAYDGEVLLMAARLYAGQTTNFRTEGGGFAPVVQLLNGRGCCGVNEGSEPAPAAGSR